jgi:hypothetical protein
LRTSFCKSRIARRTFFARSSLPVTDMRPAVSVFRCFQTTAPGCRRQPANGIGGQHEVELLFDLRRHHLARLHREPALRPQRVLPRRRAVSPVSRAHATPAASRILVSLPNTSSKIACHTAINGVNRQPALHAWAHKLDEAASYDSNSGNAILGFKVEKGGGGNWDGDAIEAITSRLGFNLRVSATTYSAIKRPFRDDPGPQLSDALRR